MHDATILFLPGLTGDSKCEYVRATSLAVQKSGFRIVVFNYRGIGGIELKVITIFNLWNKKIISWIQFLWFKSITYHYYYMHI